MGFRAYIGYIEDPTQFEENHWDVWTSYMELGKSWEVFDYTDLDDMLKDSDYFLAELSKENLKIVIETVEKENKEYIQERYHQLREWMSNGKPDDEEEINDMLSKCFWIVSGINTQYEFNNMDFSDDPYQLSDFDNWLFGIFNLMHLYKTYPFNERKLYVAGW